VIRSTITPMKTPIRSSNLLAAISLIAVVFGIARFVFAADQKQARVTEVIHDVRLLATKAAARPAAVNDTVHEGTAVRTGPDSRAELLFLDQTLTRLGANTVFSFGTGARSYDLGNGAVLMTAPKETGTVKITTAVATSAVSGFTGIWETHKNTWNKVLFLEGDGYVALKKNPNDHRQMHSWQILIFRPTDSVLPQPQDFSVCKVINNGLLITGFKNPLSSMPLLVAECQKQQALPGSPNLIDPTSQNVVDQSLNARQTPPPPPRPTPDGELMKRP
jgi:FecR protein